MTDPDTTDRGVPWSERHTFGALVHENKRAGNFRRARIVKPWILDQWPDCEIFGLWSDRGMEELEREVRPCPYEHVRTTLQRWKCTITTPASGSGWSTVKPWECFDAGVVCFFHPEYDAQDNVLGDNETLRTFLRADTAEVLYERVQELATDEQAWKDVIDLQTEHLRTRWSQTRGGILMLETALGIAPAQTGVPA